MPALAEELLPDSGLCGELCGQLRAGGAPRVKQILMCRNEVGLQQGRVCRAGVGRSSSGEKVLPGGKVIFLISLLTHWAPIVLGCSHPTLPGCKQCSVRPEFKFCVIYVPLHPWAGCVTSRASVSPSLNTVPFMGCL